MLTLQPSSRVSLTEFNILLRRIILDTNSILIDQKIRMGLAQPDFEKLSSSLQRFGSQINKMKDPKTSGFIGSDFFQWYFQALPLLDRKKFKRLHSHFLELPRRLFLCVHPHTHHIPGIPIALKQSGQVLNEAVDDLSIHLSRLYNESVVIKPLPLKKLLRHPHYKEMFADIQKALKIIRGVWPEQYQEILAVIRALSFVQGSYLNGSSALSYHGLVILNPQSEWTTLTFVDHLIHEASHQVLWTKQALGPLLLNPNKPSLASPVRWDKRPLNGIFHGTYVLCRLCMFFERMLKRKTSDELLGRFEFHVGRFYKGMDVIRKNAKFTDRGKVFFGLMENQHAKLKQFLPHPSEDAHRWAKEYD